MKSDSIGVFLTSVFAPDIATTRASTGYRQTSG